MLMDFSEIIRHICDILKKNSVEYLIVGGTAVALHGHYRKSVNLQGDIVEKPDLDCWYNPSYQNYYNLLNALEELGKDVSRYREEEAPDPKNSFFRFDFEDYSLDMLPNLKAPLKFRVSFAKREIVISEGVEICFLNYDDLIQDKESLGRPKDMDDIEHLKAINLGNQ